MASNLPPPRSLLWRHLSVLLTLIMGAGGLVTAAAAFQEKQFRSMSSHGVMQEVAALTLFLAMSQLLVVAANEEVDDPKQFASQKGAVLTLARFLTRILLEPDPDKARMAVERAIDRVLLTRDRHRPGRSWPRRSFKPTPKWCATGRRRA